MCAAAELVKAISAPLSACVKGFPIAERLHPFERALLDLTFGPDMYQKRLARLAALRQTTVEVGLSTYTLLFLLLTLVSEGSIWQYAGGPGFLSEYCCWATSGTVKAGLLTILSG